MVTPKVAVLLAAYNGVSWLSEQVSSILGQIEVDVEVFISVDSSQDGTEAWVSKVACENKNVKPLPYGCEFGGAAVNFYWLVREVDVTEFDYIAFSDQDDIWFPDKLIRSIRVLDGNKYDAYSSNVIAFWPDGRKSLINKAQAQREMDYLFEAAGPGCTYVLNKGLAVGVKEFILGNWAVVKEIKLHDWLFYAYARSHGYRWFIDPEPTMFYRQHSSNQLGANIGFYAAFRRIHAIASGEWMLQAKTIAALVSREEKSLVSLFGSFERIKMLKLAIAPFRYRRRFRDQFFLSLAFVFLVFYKPRKLRF
ncbi:glycosyltransferase [Halomonas sp. McH1-25]|uniref:glycosyltransferase n=1 Tax=unclassified Halomonas TaxID=2609666 RepID=UPI001EF55FF7|nr:MULTISPECIES: glycosyltransferase [unclassified Halomonas]MCG7598277.1 glycosyltransferase [Halomonas sp. McH1-25]MCP1340940.1 glycosyltransferase [Halomonas sp. FL8]MCP1362511.1 glycosyltransferase [Halomonas sp. BBD45]MCP1363982.1 glycosyltransferase [Halomonas sp. BBD48]